MQSTTSPRHLATHPEGFQCLSRRPFSFHSTEESIKYIEVILAKSLLCPHDVNDLVKVHHNLMALDNNAAQLTSTKNQHVLTKVAEKVKQVSCLKPMTAKGLISLCHLQRFEVNVLQCDQQFKRALKECLATPNTLKEAALRLPYCSTEADFEVDVTNLFGVNPSQDISDILTNKREDKRKTVDRLKQLKKQIKELRRQNPQAYPAYLRELFDNGYIQLLEHLIQMAQLPSRASRIEANYKMTFSLLSHVILQTRDAVIRKVESSIPADCKKVLFLVGGSGSGKSTTLCFLRGDRLVVRDNFSFESHDAQEGIIGHEGATSCTFLPTIGQAGNMFIIDFPGFDDTNGPVITLGMECALKSLVKKYHPQILVVESITNNEGRATQLAKLGTRLERLFENKENCLLGITKYSRDPDFITLQNIENRQREELSRPSQAESVLAQNINNLVGLNNPALNDIIQQRRAELERYQLEREQRQQHSLPETEEKAACRRRIQAKEELLLKEIGLRQMISFSDPSDPSLREPCLLLLSSQADQEAICVNPNNQLDADQKDLIKNRFELNLAVEMKSKSKQDYHIEFDDFPHFEKSVLESSLINTVLSQANPEIGRFLHLPEIDPALVREFDNAVVRECITKCWQSIIGSLNMTYFNKVIKEIGPDVSKEIVSQLRQNLDKLYKYILGILGEPVNDPNQAAKKWKELQERYMVTEEAVNARFQLPTWAKILSFLPLAMPRVIFRFVQLNALRKSRNENSQKVFQECNEQIINMHHMLQGLIDIGKIIAKQDSLETTYGGVCLSTQTLQTLLESNSQKIKLVKEAYGNAKKEWDNRVEYLAERISIHNFDPKKPFHAFFITAYVTASLWSCFFDSFESDLRENLVREQDWNLAIARALSHEMHPVLMLASEEVHKLAERIVEHKTREILRNRTASAECLKRAQTILEMKNPLEKKKIAALILVELIKKGLLHLKKIKFCAVSLKDTAHQPIIQILGIGDLPEIVDANDLTNRDLPLIRTLLAAATQYKIDKLSKKK